MPPIIVLAAGAFAAGAIVHRLIKEVRRINSELDRVKTGRAIDPVLMCQPSHEGRSCETRARPVAALALVGCLLRSPRGVSTNPRPASAGFSFGRNSKAARALHRAALETNCRAGPRFRPSAG
jgi:hypothetical protein